MNTNSFYNAIQEALQKALGSGYEVSLELSHEMNSSNDCIMIKKKSFTDIQTFSLAEFYEDFLSGYPIPSIAEDIIGIYEAVGCHEELEEEIPYEYAAVKDSLVPGIVSLSENQKLLAKVPCIELTDLGLLVIFYVELDCVNHSSIHFMVTNRQLSVWNISKAAFIRSAVKRDI